MENMTWFSGPGHPFRACIAPCATAGTAAAANEAWQAADLDDEDYASATA